MHRSRAHEFLVQFTPKKMAVAETLSKLGEILFEIIFLSNCEDVLISILIDWIVEV